MDAVEKRKMLEKKDGYMEAIGRRKTAVARVRIMKGDGKSIVVNNVDITKHFPTSALRGVAISPLEIFEETFNISVQIKGGGSSSQAGAMRHGLARALVDFDPEQRKKTKDSGFLKRDPRKKERKKPGLRKARRAPQWSKR